MSGESFNPNLNHGPSLIMDNSIILHIDNISVTYSHYMEFLKDVSLSVDKGRIVALLGKNGAGKSTVLKTISGLLKLEHGKIIKGHIGYDGESIRNLCQREIARKGIIYVLEGRGFRALTVEENLKVGTAPRQDKPSKKDLEMIYYYFPPLLARKKSLAGSLSSGELQMLAIGRALMAHPRLLLLDEPSFGLAPLFVTELFEIIKKINVELGVALLIAEQNANIALKTAHYGYVMEGGKIIFENNAEDLRTNQDVKEFFRGTNAAGALKPYQNFVTFKHRSPRP